MRSIWKGHIRFLLVAIPVRIYNAIETAEKIQFNQLHREDYGPIGYDKRCKKCSQVVSNDQITKGYQYEPDRYAIVEPEDIAKVKIKTTKAVDIVGFVDSSEIPTTFYDAPYYAGPDGPVSEKPYALLREVMKQTGKVGIGKIVLRDREDLVALFPHEDGLVMQKLHYPNEIRSMKDVPELASATKVDKNEMKMATMLVEQAITVENAGVRGSSPASMVTSRARLDHISEGMTAPQMTKSGAAPANCPAMALTTGTDNCRASADLNAPSTFSNGVRSPGASQMSGPFTAWPGS